MGNEVLSYLEMCQREGTNLQRGMNFGLGGFYSVILMSTRPNAPYQDRIEEDGTVLIYEGHDEPKRSPADDPKAVDQPGRTRNGTPTENGKFYAAAMAYRHGQRGAELVRVYEKIRGGIWSNVGIFQLVDAWQMYDGRRNVFKFKLMLVDEGVSDQRQVEPYIARSRVIPSAVKLEVWKRDGGKCRECGATDELHFDHILPYSKGGTSITAENVQLLCARHNLSKGARIE